MLVIPRPDFGKKSALDSLSSVSGIGQQFKREAPCFMCWKEIYVVCWVQRLPDWQYAISRKPRDRLSLILSTMPRFGACF